MRFNLQRILHALLMSTSEPLSIRDIQGVITRYHQQRIDVEDDPEEVEPPGDDGQEEIADIMDQVPSLLTATQIRDAMDELSAELVEQDATYRLVQGAAGYRFVVAPGYAEWVRLLRNENRPMRLSNAALETLAIVAYRQPVTRAEIEAIRGVSVDGPLSKLQELELVYVAGRAELPGRPLHFATTEKFLDFTGIRGLEELPASDVLSPAALSDWIHQATQGKGDLSDHDMGLAEETPTQPATPQAELDLSAVGSDSETELES
ncbi:MAG: SMC-Scp complex subunit ScpB [Opitutales bacterium]